MHSIMRTTLLVAVCSLLFSASAQAVQVTGLSDQHLHEWASPSYEWLKGFKRIRQARYIVDWNAALDPASNRYRAVRAWYDRAIALGLRPIISFSRVPEL